MSGKNTVALIPDYKPPPLPLTFSMISFIINYFPNVVNYYFNNIYSHDRLLVCYHIHIINVFSKCCKQYLAPWVAEPLPTTNIGLTVLINATVMMYR